MTLTFDLSSQGSILFKNVGYVDEHLNTNFLHPILDEISRFKYTGIITLIFDLGGQGHILIPVLAIFGVAVKINFL